jgi:uncharacterized membrane protein
LVFAGVSTYDFVQHLDRQVHSLHCSFIPGGGADAGASGCQVAMMSPYSSVFRTTIWGGIPISLPAMAVFAFILFYAGDVLARRKTEDPRATGFLALATCLPAAASLVMAIVSLTKLGTTCKLCVGVYVASALSVVGAVALWRRAAAHAATLPDLTVGSAKDGSEPRLEAQVESPPTTNGYLGSMFALGVGFVALPVVLYLVLAPDHGRFVGTCGELVQPDDTYGVMVPMQRGAVPALEILDPLCPACKAFEQRLDASRAGAQLDRKAIMFPLDTTCNWMITENTHPGACTISEAVLCAGDRAPQVIQWAFQVQEQVRAETAKDPEAAARIVKARFPELAACVGSPVARSRLNKSLRWAVANNIRVLTPQLFVNNVKLCDEDVDLGLDYALARMVEGTMPMRPQLAKPLDAAAPVAAPPSATTEAVAPGAPAAPGAAPAPTGPTTGATGESNTAPAAPAAAGTLPPTPEPQTPPATPTTPPTEQPTAPAPTPTTAPAEPTEKAAATPADKPADPLPTEDNGGAP